MTTHQCQVHAVMEEGGSTNGDVDNDNDDSKMTHLSRSAFSREAKTALTAPEFLMTPYCV